MAKGTTNRSRRRRTTKRYTAPEFRPYVTALGQLTLAWNDLQESLGTLFWTVMNKRPPMAGDFVDYTPLMVWHSVKSDRQQRVMLKAAVGFDGDKSGRTIYFDGFNRPQFADDVRWLLIECDKLEDARNNAIHSPLFSTVAFRIGLGAAIQASEPVRPAYWQFNPRAVSLDKRKNLLSEFRYCRDMAMFLADYAHLMDSALTHPQRPWPKRSTPPNREPKTNRPDRRLRSDREPPQPPPRSSPG